MDSTLIKNRISSIQFTFNAVLITGIVTILYTFLPLYQIKYRATFQPITYHWIAQCPLVSPMLVGLIKVVVDDNRTAEINEGMTMTVKTGGSYEPTECRPRYNVAIIVPFRDREAHLKAFLANLHPFLQRQLLAYTIFIVEQSNSSKFNRGMLMNIGYVEALKTKQTFDCFYLHDVDLVPEDDRHSYACPEEGRPRQMAVLLSSLDYKPYTGFVYFGGVTAILTRDFKTINGFSNRYWGWGAEDDDLYKRVLFHNMSATYHKPESEARYTMLFHEKAEGNPKRLGLLSGAIDRIQYDGLNDLQYSLLDFQLKLLYTYILVDIQPKNETV